MKGNLLSLFGFYFFFVFGKADITNTRNVILVCILIQKKSRLHYKNFRVLLILKTDSQLFLQGLQEMNHLFLYSGILLYTEDLIA